MQQIVSAIQLRRADESRVERTNLSWAVRTLATFIAAGYMTDGDNPAIEQAQEITLDDLEQQIMKADLPKPEVKNEPKKGSTETLMRAFSRMTSM